MEWGEELSLRVSEWQRSRLHPSVLGHRPSRFPRCSCFFPRWRCWESGSWRGAKYRTRKCRRLWLSTGQRGEILPVTGHRAASGIGRCCPVLLCRRHPTKYNIRCKKKTLPWKQKIDQSIDRSINQSMDQSINQSANRPINQSIDQNVHKVSSTS